MASKYTAARNATLTSETVECAVAQCPTIENLKLAAQAHDDAARAWDHHPLALKCHGVTMSTWHLVRKKEFLRMALVAFDKRETKPI